MPDLSVKVLKPLKAVMTQNVIGLLFTVVVFNFICVVKCQLWSLNAKQNTEGSPMGKKGLYNGLIIKVNRLRIWFIVETKCYPHRGHGAVVQGFIGKQHRVFNKHSAGSQDKRGEQVDVDVVSSAVELPV